MNTTLTRLASAGAGLALIGGVTLAATPAFAGDATVPPTANPDSFVTPMDVSFSIDAANGLLFNDNAGGNPDLIVDSFHPVSGGSVSAFKDGSFTFTPDPGFVGQAVFEYRDMAGGYTSDWTTVYVDVMFVPHKLIGAPDFFTTPKNTFLEVSPYGVIDNDPDMTYVGGIDDVTGEVIVGLYGKLEYTPAPGFVGTKTFSYFLDDGENIPSDWILVTIEVTDPPISVIPSDPIVPGDPGTPDSGTGSDLPTLAYTGTDDVTGWLVAPGLALVIVGAGAVWFARRSARA